MISITRSTPSEPVHPAARGWVDIHSHLLPGVDDGCRTFEESLECVRRLKKAGFIGSICTPHFLPDQPDCPRLEQIARWTSELQARLDQVGVGYRLWPGAEVRLFDGMESWLEVNRPPTLAGSRCVLVDFWEDGWPAWVNRSLDHLLRLGYQPILAHPERLKCVEAVEQIVDELAEMGVWFQGNFRCFTGEEGQAAGQWVRRLLQQDRYHFLALDMHRPNQLAGRLVGMKIVEEEFGRDALLALTSDAPHDLVLPNGVC